MVLLPPQARESFTPAGNDFLEEMRLRSSDSKLMQPRHATDSHFHVFGPVDRFPQSAARYDPILAPLEEFEALAKADGIERMVFVQPSAYGKDNRCMLEAMERVEPVLRRGIAGLDPSIGEAELRKLHDLGVRGVRINVSPVQKFEPGLSERVIDEANAMAKRIAPLGWSLDFLGPAWLTRALFPTMRALPLEYSVAHIGMFLAKDGVDQPGFAEFLDLLRGGRAWAKITGLYRISVLPDFDDIAPLAKAVFKANPDRVIWGSDWPHISFAGRVTNARELELLRGWCADDELYRKILVNNPARLYGF